MNARDILIYGHKDVLNAFQGVKGDEWEAVGVTSRWSLKDMLAHLLSYELLLEDAFKYVLKEESTPMLDAMGKGMVGFNDDQVALRVAFNPAELMTEYTTAHQRIIKALSKFTPEQLRQVGTIPWYGPEYSLDDLIVYINYSHKREHCAQVKSFRKKIGA